MFLSLILLMCYITLIDFGMLNHLVFLHKSHLVMVYNPIYILLNLICKYFLEVFVSIFIKDISLSFSFLVMALSGFGISNTGLRMN